MLHVTICTDDDPFDREVIDVTKPAGRFMICPYLGPTATLLAEYLHLRGDHSYELIELATALGVNLNVIDRTITRLERFHVLEFVSADVVRVRQFVRLPKYAARGQQ